MRFYPPCAAFALAVLLVAFDALAGTPRREARGHGTGKASLAHAVARAPRSHPPAPPTPKADASPEPSHSALPHAPTRLDFDDRLITGQTNKSGAVYLYDRKELPLQSLVKMRGNFRREMKEPFYGS